jgi:hypothetical protein
MSTETEESMAKLITTVDHTEPGEDGWRLTHHVRRADGEEVEVEVNCTKAAEELLRRLGDSEASAALDDRGVEAALRTAEDALPRRGPTRIRLSFDHATGALRHSFDYTWPPAAKVPKVAS